MADLDLEFAFTPEELAQITADLSQPVSCVWGRKPRLARRGALEKALLKFSPINKKAISSWGYTLARTETLKGLPAAGRSMLAVFRSLVDWMDSRTGVCDPSWKQIGQKARYKRTQVWACLKWLESHGVIHTIPCSAKIYDNEGRYSHIEQVTNCYVFLPPSQWRLKGIPQPPQPPPPPSAQEWGAAPPLAYGLAGAAAAPTFEEKVELLGWDKDDPLAVVLARFGKALGRPPDPD